MNRDVCEHFNPAPCAGCKRLALADTIEQDPTTTWGYREASHAAAAELRRPIEAERQRDHARACYERAVKLLVSIHSLMYPPPITLPDGRTMVFRPSGTDPNTILQELSDRIRALPEELDAIARAKGQA
jgi:hypothetical protein